MNPYVLGIDGGGTKFLVRAVAPDGRVLGEYRGPSCSHYRFPVTEVIQRTEANLAACLATFGGRSEDCLAIACGTTGYDSPEDGELLREIYNHLTGFHCPVRVMNDVELAFRVACGSEGVLMLAGTGSVCFGRNAAGSEARVGGWPAGIFGDEGSGRYIDALAMRHYSRWMDGCREETQLIREIREITEIKTRKQLLDFAVELSHGTAPVPNLGACVTRAAEAGDAYAGVILTDAAHRLAEVAEEAIRLLYPDPEAVFPLGIWGSVLMNACPVREVFAAEIIRRHPGASLCVPERDAAQGAVEMALEIC